MNIVYIHGASASGESFNYIRGHLEYKDEIILEYDSADGFQHNLENMIDALSGVSDMYFVCHSLGGVYALHLAAHYSDRVRGATTISTPYGGAESADYTKYFLPFSRLLRDIGPNSLPIRTSRDIVLQCPWTNIVTTRGNSPWILHPNDGVVTIKSQCCRSDMELIELDINHYEVVLSLDTVDIIKENIKQIQNDTTRA